jgi:hypothetical protein
LVLKIAPLLAQYLYSNGKLALTGIGTFSLENHTAVTLTDNKTSPLILDGVQFTYNKTQGEDPALIAYISSESGKIKPLASADLDSHLELAKQFLNIGKPFLFEGIGTLSKSSNEFTFTPGHVLPESLKEPSHKEDNKLSKKEVQHNFSDLFYGKKKSDKKAGMYAFVFFLCLGGLALAIWGGYAIYNRSNKRNEGKPTQSIKTNSQEEVNKSQPSNTLAGTTTGVPMGSYKFVLEQSDSTRAHKRFARLKTFGWNVVVEKNNPTTYQLFLILPATPSDTARLVDSLRRLNGKQVMIQ